MESTPSAAARIQASGATFIVDESDSEMVSGFKWQARRSVSGRLYIQGKNGQLSRWLLNAPSGMHVDHINGNTLDNRRCNLRVCTPSQNQWNRKRSPGVTRLKGVAKISDPRAVSKWRATIQKNGKRHTIGMFRTALAAALAYDAAAVELFGEFAAPNFPERLRNI